MIIATNCMPLRPEAFVYVQEVEPAIRVSLRYCGTENFMGRRVPGYNRPVAILTEKAVAALVKAQKKFNEQGYDIVIYDAYRPQKAVESFKSWSADAQDQLRKADYYPQVNKADLFDLGFVASKSAHSRGSTVDLSIIEIGKDLLHPVRKQERSFSDGVNVIYLDDNTVDMGVHFDFFGTVSFTNDKTISAQAQANRKFLQEVMAEFGFENYAKEWWHFQLQEEENTECYYDFDVE